VEGRPVGPSQPAGARETTKPIGRGLFLGLIGAGAVGTVVGQQFQGIAGTVLGPFTNSGGAGLAALIPGSDRFPLYTVTGRFPAVTTERYSLSVGGLVERPLHLSFAGLG
jgi:hypothetical protein